MIIGTKTIGSSFRTMVADKRVLMVLGGSLSVSTVPSKVTAYVDGLGSGSGSQRLKALLYVNNALVAESVEVIVASGSAGAWLDFEFTDFPDVSEPVVVDPTNGQMDSLAIGFMAGTASNVARVAFNTTGNCVVDDSVYDDGALAFLSPYFNGGVVVTGALAASNSNTTFTRTAAGAGWDAQAYSVASYTTNCYATAKATTVASKTMFGLNSDPTTDANFTGIDYAWNFAADGIANVYESGSLTLASGAYTTSTVLKITYDGTNVRWLKDNVVVKTVASAVGSALYFDSSFNTSATALTSVGFGGFENATLSAFAVVRPLWQPPAASIVDDEYLAGLSFTSAQNAFTRDSAPVVGTNKTVTAGWHGTYVNDSKGSFAVVKTDGLLADFVGERVLVTHRLTRRSVAVYVITESDLITEEISLARRPWIALGSPSDGNLIVSAQVLG